METTSILEWILGLDQGNGNGGMILHVFEIQPIGFSDELDVGKREKSQDDLKIFDLYNKKNVDTIY